MISSQSKTDKKSTALSFDEFKKSLGLRAAKYTDNQIKQMWLVCDRIADAVFNDWLVKNKIT
jgi:hypothetical protein